MKDVFEVILKLPVPPSFAEMRNAHKDLTKDSVKTLTVLSRILTKP